MKAAIAIAATLAVLASLLYFMGAHGGWVAKLIDASGAALHSPEGGLLFGQDPHKLMYYVSAGVGFVGILIAAFLHGPKGIWSLFLGNRTRAEVSPRADALANLFGPLTRLARNKYYVDEVYDFIIVKPLWVLSHIFHLIDKLLVDGLVNAAGWLPRSFGQLAKRTQSGVLHDYALRMAGGLALIVLVVLAVRSGVFSQLPGGGLWR